MTVKSKVNVVTFGCPKNIVDSEFLLGQLVHNNIQLVKDAESADILVINTCGFIQDAKQESIDTILEAIEKKKKGEIKKIIVMGCLAERYKKELVNEMPEVDSLFGTNQLSNVLHAIDSDHQEIFPKRRLITTPAHYAYLKIAEGCDNPCSFCSIPLMRGRHKSRTIDELVDEARYLSENGVRELILVAQDTTYYGVDNYGKRELASLLYKLNDVDGIDWIRLLYTYPAKFPLDIIDAFVNCKKICHYIDIPIQHCSDKILKSMQRGITKKVMSKLIQDLKNGIPNLALRTTIIVGYPSEAQEDFEELCSFVQEMKFHRLGVFKYSQEEGTEAFSLGDPIPIEVKEERESILMEIQREISLRRNEEFVGKTLKVLIDSNEGNFYIGRTEWDAPEIDQEVVILSKSPLKQGTFYDVKITDAAEYDLFANI